MYLRLVIVLFVQFLIGASAVVAETQRPTVFIRPVVQVRGENITLGDVARIIYEGADKEKRIAELSQIPLGTAPIPKGSQDFSGAKILQLIEESGIAKDSIGYSIPQTITVQRLGRTIDVSELLPIVREKLTQETAFDLQVREITMKQDHVIPLGDSRFEVQILGKPQGGRVPVRVAAYVGDRPEARFLATAVVDDWREIPVLKRNVDRGMLITPEDIESVRLNLFSQPRDVAGSFEDVIGRRVKTRLKAGDVVRKSMIDIPPTIPRGKQVTMTFAKGNFRATALGQALEDGLEGELIKLRNVDSKKTVKGKVTSENEVVVVTQ